MWLYSVREKLHSYKITINYYDKGHSMWYDPTHNVLNTICIKMKKQKAYEWTIEWPDANYTFTESVLINVR